MKARAVAFVEAGRVEVVDVDVPQPGPGEVLTETLYTCISPGTELRVLAGKQPAAPGWPLVPGYMNVGRVIARGAGVTIAEGTLCSVSGTRRASIGRMWGGHVSHVVRDAREAVVVPDGVEPAEMCMCKLAEIAYHGLRLSNPKPDEAVACVGLGPIGMISAMLHTLTGARVVGFDLFPERVALARSLGVDAEAVGAELGAVVRGRFPAGVDVMVDATGSAAVLRQTPTLIREPAWGTTLRDLPRMLLQGSYAGDISFDYHELFNRECAILFPRDRTPADTAAVVGLLVRRKLVLRPLAGEPVGVEQAPAVYRQLREAPRERMTALFRWS